MKKKLNELEMAKKRNYKIMIIEEAICKVPRIKAVDKNNEANNLRSLQDAADYFLKNSYNVAIDYDNR